MDLAGIALLAVSAAFAVLLALVVRKMARHELNAPARPEALPEGEESAEDQALAREALGIAEEAPKAEAPKAKAEAPPPAEEPAMLRGLQKTRKGFMARLNELFTGKALDPALVDELEALLVTSDLGIRTTQRLLGDLKGELTRQQIKDADQVRARLRAKIEEIVDQKAPPFDPAKRPFVLMVIGVNGVGKTTTIGKLAARLTAQGKKVVLAAGDTFRAAAAEQLEIWGQRSGAPVVRGPENGDPGAVVFEAIQKAQAMDADYCICDTAGRLHTKVNLMEELKKLRRVMNKALEGAPHEVMLVLDATTGQNAISQAKQFKEAVEVQSLALTKLDGTAKGGVVVAICDEFNVPVRLVGIGEKVEDLRDFDPKEFVDALFAP